MSKLLVAISAMILLSGCASSLSVDKLQNFTPKSKVLVLTDHSRFDAKLRIGLEKKGFKVLKFFSTQKIISQGKSGEIARIYNKAEARYALTFYWDKVDGCLLNSSKKINATFEITDIRTNEVLLVIEKAGWTGSCAYHKGMIFEDLGEALLQSWGK